MRVRPDLRQAVAAQLAGETPPPPAEQLLGIRLVSSADGGAVFELEVAERHLSPTGAVPGGILATLADGAMATAVVSTLAPEETCLTLELKINFVRAVFAGTLVARGSTIARTRTTGIAECRVTAPPLIEVAPGHHVACLRRPVGGDPGALPIA